MIDKKNGTNYSTMSGKEKIMQRLIIIMTTAPFSTPISPSEIPTNLCRQDTLLSTPKINEESDEYVYQVLSPGNKKFGPILYC